MLGQLRAPLGCARPRAAVGARAPGLRRAQHSLPGPRLCRTRGSAAWRGQAAAERGAPRYPSVLESVKATNSALRKSESVAQLRDRVRRAEVLDAICISTAWTRLGNLCGYYEAAQPGAGDAPAQQARQLAEAQAFARDTLLDLTAEWLPKMRLRAVSNTLWAMGKLRLELAAEGERGQKAAAAVEARLLELLAKPGLQDARDAEQLWLGLTLCEYGWSNRLLRVLTDATLAKVVEWSGNAKILCQICSHVPIMLEGRNLRIGPRQRAALAEAIRLAVSSPHSNQQELLLGCHALLFAGAELDLPLDASTAQRLHGLALMVPLVKAQMDGLKVTASNLINAARLGYQPTAAEAQAWLQRFQDLTGRDIDTWTAEEFGYVVGALESCRAFKPPPAMLRRLRREVAVLPPQEGEAQRGTLPWRLQLACTAWDVQL